MEKGKVQEYSLNNFAGGKDDGVTKTRIKEVGLTANPSRLNEIWVHVKYVHERLDKLEDLTKAFFIKLTDMDKKMVEFQDILAGKNPEFEAEVRKSTAKPVTLSESQSSMYGTPVTDQLLDIVHATLGRDFGAFLKANRGMGSQLFSVLVPSRLSGVDFDFRSTTIYDISGDSDVKKWCERVKSNLFKTYASQNKGTPALFIR